MPSPRVFLTFGLGIGLVCTSAAAAVEPAEETAADLVRVPPLLVESSTGQPWLYCEVDGFEILSRCSRATTGQLVRSFVRANEGLDTLLPARFRLRTEAPELLLFYEVALWPKALTQMVLAQEGLALFASEPVLQFRAAVLYQKLGDLAHADVLAKEALR